MNHYQRAHDSDQGQGADDTQEDDGRVNAQPLPHDLGAQPNIFDPLYQAV